MATTNTIGKDDNPPLDTKSSVAASLAPAKTPMDATLDKTKNVVAHSGFSSVVKFGVLAAATIALAAWFLYNKGDCATGIHWNNLRYVGQCLDKEPHGEGVLYNGEDIAQKGRFDHGKLTKGMKYFGRQPWEEGSFQNNNLINGTEYSLRNPGVPLNKGIFQDNQLIRGIHFDNQGIPKSDGNFANGQLIVGTEYSSTKTWMPEREGTFVRGELQGIGMECSLMECWRGPFAAVERQGKGELYEVAHDSCNMSWRRSLL